MTCTRAVSYTHLDVYKRQVLSLPDLSAGEMVDFCNRARKKYYLRASYILHRLRVGLRNPSDLKRSLKAFAKLKRYLFK